MARRPPSQTGVHQTSRRINCSSTRARHFPKRGKRTSLTGESQQLKHLVPRSHKFQAQFSLLQKEQQRSQPLKRTTNNRSTEKLTAVIVDSQVVNCNRFSYQQVIHIPRSLQAPRRYLTYYKARKMRIFTFSTAWLSYPKSVHSVETDTSMTRMKKSQSSLWRRHTGQETVSRGQPSEGTKILIFNRSQRLKVIAMIVCSDFPFM